MQTITAPSAWKTLDSVDELPQPIDQLPQWIDREGITDVERRARNTLAEELKPGESVGLTLLELNDPRGGGVAAKYALLPQSRISMSENLSHLSKH